MLFQSFQKMTGRPADVPEPRRSLSGRSGRRITEVGLRGGCLWPCSARAVECEQQQRCLRGQSFNIDYKLERGSRADRLQLWVCTALKWPAPVGGSQALVHEERLQLCACLWERMSHDATATEPATDRGRDLGETQWESCQQQLLSPHQRERGAGSIIAREVRGEREHSLWSQGSVLY